MAPITWASFVFIFDFNQIQSKEIDSQRICGFLFYFIFVFISSILHTLLITAFYLSGTKEAVAGDETAAEYAAKITLDPVLPLILEYACKHMCMLALLCCDFPYWP